MKKPILAVTLLALAAFSLPAQAQEWGPGRHDHGPGGPGWDEPHGHEHPEYWRHHEHWHEGH